MNDLILLSTPVLTGLFLGQSVFLYRCRGNPLTETESRGRPPESTAAEPCPFDAAILADINKDTRRDHLAMARIALDTIPDVSCDAVAEAFGLPHLSVRRLSTKKRRKGKQVTEVGTYSNDQILAAGSGVTWV